MHSPPVELSSAEAFELFDLMTESVAVYDRDARIRYVNEATATILGRPRAALVGQVLWDLFPDAAGNDFHQAFVRVAATGRAESFELHDRQFDRWFVNHVSPWSGGVVVYAIDITAQKRARDRMERLARASRAIAESAFAPATAYASIARVLAGELRDGCAIRLLGDDGMTEVVAFHHVDPAADATIGGAVRGRRAPATAGIAAPVFASGEPLVVGEARDAMVLPMIAGARVVGVIELARSHTGAPYDSEDLALARELTDRASAALVNARLYAENEQARRDAERLLRFTEALSRCVTVAEVAAAAVTAARVLLDVADSRAWLEGDGAPPPEPGDPGVVMPLVARGRTVGTVVMRLAAGRALDEDDRKLLAAMSAQATLALERCELFAAERAARAAALRSARRSSRLQEATAAVTAASGSAAVARELIRVAAEALDARAGFVGAIVPAGETIDVLAAHGFQSDTSEWRHVPIAGTLVERVVETAGALWLEDIDAVGAIGPGPRQRVERLGASIAMRPGGCAAAPLRIGATVTGALVLLFDGPRVFVDDDRELVAALTALAAQALDRARLFEAELSTRRALEAANAKLEAIIVSTPTPVVMLDEHTRVELWNPAAERTFGWSAAEVLGRELPIVAGEQRDEFRGLLARLARDGSVAGHEGLRRRRDGSGIAVSVWAAPVRLPDGSVHYIAVLLDMSERKRAEEALRDAGRRKDEFLALLGHELRNPLAPILTAVDLLKLRAAGATSREVATIERQARHLVALVDDLLDVARITRGKVTLRRESLELATVVAQALETTSTLIEQRRHVVEVDVPRAGLVVSGDARRLVQVVANLLNNAATYTAPGGRIVVRARRVDGEVALSVSDSGAGFTAELAARMFEPFVQGHRSPERLEGGLGLGLALVRSLVELHGGAVVADSAGPGQGSTFTVTLPLVLAAALAGPVEAPLAAAPSPRPAARVLVVDDNQDAAELLAEALNAAGHEALAVFGPTEALRCVESFTPDVAVLDVGMPVMDGYELGARLRARLGDGLRLVAVTGYGQDRDHERSREAGFHAHLVKPVDLPTLLDQL